VNDNQRIDAYSVWSVTFVVEEEPSLCGAGLGSDEVEIDRAGLNVDDLLAGSAALAEVRRGGLRRRDLEVVVTETGAFHVQLEVKQSDADRLPATHGHRPVTVGTAEVLLRVVGTGYVAVVVQHRTVGRRTTAGYFKPCKKKAEVKAPTVNGALSQLRPIKRVLLRTLCDFWVGAHLRPFP